MSEKLEDELLEQLNALVPLLKLAPMMKRLTLLIYGLLAGAVAITSWVVMIEIRTQEAGATKRKVDEIALWRARMDESRYTAADAAAFSDEMQRLLHYQEIRVQRVEDAAASIKDAVGEVKASLSRMESQLDRRRGSD